MNVNAGGREICVSYFALYALCSKAPVAASYPCYPRAPMFNSVVARIWRWLPKNLRRWTLRFSNTTFTVTVAGLIFNEKGEVLLLKHRFRPGSGWGIPGGFLEANEHPLEALKRELTEEVGLEIDSIEIFDTRSFKLWRQVEILFRGQSRGQPQPRSVEVERAVWFPIDDLPAGLPADQKSLVERAVANRQI